MRKPFKLENDYFTTIVEIVRNRYRISLTFKKNKRKFTLHATDFIDSLKSVNKFIEKMKVSPDGHLLNEDVELNLRADVKLAVQMV